MIQFSGAMHWPEGKSFTGLLLPIMHFTCTNTCMSTDRQDSKPLTHRLAEIL